MLTFTSDSCCDSLLAIQSLQETLEETFRVTDMLLADTIDILADKEVSEVEADNVKVAISLINTKKNFSQLEEFF